MKNPVGRRASSGAAENEGRGPARQPLRLAARRDRRERGRRGEQVRGESRAGGEHAERVLECLFFRSQGIFGAEFWAIR